mmetsp:Transcript_43806/g.106228  ORF Transcript_43806/g.106228 Transcript_43806/m.106228 type:complete len:930 (-) Transcript_43806:110-2899(-)
MRVDTIRPELRQKICDWIISFYHLDPRYKILTFFNLVASEGADKLANDEDGDFIDDYDLDRETSHLSTSRHHDYMGGEGTSASLGGLRNNHNNYTRAQSADMATIGRPEPISEGVRAKTIAAGDLRPSATNLGLRQSTIEMMSKFFDASSIATVWRPCSNDAMRKMMEGTGVGKGLDIKGKSAKKGILSAFVPYMQIHENAHKPLIQPIPSGSEMRIYYTSEQERKQVMEFLQKYIDERQLQQDQSTTSSSPTATGSPEKSLRLSSLMSSSSMWSKSDLKMKTINKFINKRWYGLQVSQRLFWFATVHPKNVNIDRSFHRDGGRTVTGRPSTPGFQDANNKTLRTAAAQIPKPDPMPVVIQYNGMLARQRDEEKQKEKEGDKNQNGDDGDDNDDVDYSPLDPLYLVMAYEESGAVTPVVSDFDGFLLGWRREALWFGCNLPRDQEKLMMWCIDQIEQILESPMSTDTWTCRWLDVLKQENAARSAQGGFHPDIPEYGFGDPKSYTIMEQAAVRLKTTGAVRHGSECFNYYFPQEIDDVFLLISDTLRPVPWRYVNVNELQSILSQKIAEGFVFPLNPKWILCDPGWYDLYQKLMASDALYADLSKDVWYPPFSGVRERIDAIRKKFPDGFQRMAGRISKRGSISVTRGYTTGDQAAEDAKRAQEELLEELQTSNSSLFADDYTPLRDNLRNEGFGEQGSERSHLSGNAAADLAEIELENFVSVKHTLARQIYEAHLEDMDEEDELDHQDNDEHGHHHQTTGTGSRRSMASTVSGGSGGGNTTSGSSDGRISLGDVSPTQGVSRRTMFKKLRDSQKASEGRYRTGPDDDDEANTGTDATTTPVDDDIAVDAATTNISSLSIDGVKEVAAPAWHGHGHGHGHTGPVADPRTIFAHHLMPSNPRRNFATEFPPSQEFTMEEEEEEEDNGDDE